MYKTQHRNLNMKNQGNVSSLNFYHNNSISESKDTELNEMLERVFRSILLKMIRDFKEDSNKQINKVRKSIPDLEKTVNIMEKKFSKEMEIMKNNQVETLEMKTSIKQIQITMDNIISRQKSNRRKNITD
jgi:predicted patatin/cPLA2 family phospholipase